MTALIITASILTHLTAWTLTWRTVQTRYLEHVIATNVEHYPSLYCNEYSTTPDYRRGYTNFDRTEGRFFGFVTGLFWPLTLTYLTLRYLLRHVTGPLEIVPPTERHRRTEEKARQLARDRRDAERHTRYLEREHDLPSLDVDLGNPATVEAFRRDQP